MPAVYLNIQMASKMSLFWPNDDYTTYASDYLYV